jgi:hypothetical protein
MCPAPSRQPQGQKKSNRPTVDGADRKSGAAGPSQADEPGPQTRQARVRKLTRQGRKRNQTNGETKRDETRRRKQNASQSVPVSRSGELPNLAAPGQQGVPVWLLGLLNYISGTSRGTKPSVLCTVGMATCCCYIASQPLVYFVHFCLSPLGVWAFKVGGGLLHAARNQSPRIASVGSRLVF